MLQLFMFKFQVILVRQAVELTLQLGQHPDYLQLITEQMLPVLEQSQVLDFLILLLKLI